jgi:thiosulfate dehydrogenase [quinone] large subunit
VVNENAPAPAPVDYQWDFTFDPDKGWITSGFQHSPTEQYVDNNAHGPLAFIPQNLPVGLDDFGWMFAIGGLAVALTLGICSRLAGWGGLALNVMLWFSAFPPSNNPIFDTTHFTLAFTIFLLMWLQLRTIGASAAGGAPIPPRCCTDPSARNADLCGLGAPPRHWLGVYGRGCEVSWSYPAVRVAMGLAENRSDRC